MDGQVDDEFVDRSCIDAMQGLNSSRHRFDSGNIPTTKGMQLTRVTVVAFKKANYVNAHVLVTKRRNLHDRLEKKNGLTNKKPYCLPTTLPCVGCVVTSDRNSHISATTGSLEEKACGYAAERKGKLDTIHLETSMDLIQWKQMLQKGPSVTWSIPKKTCSHVKFTQIHIFSPIGRTFCVFLHKFYL